MLHGIAGALTAGAMMECNARSMLPGSTADMTVGGNLAGSTTGTSFAQTHVAGFVLGTPPLLAETAEIPLECLEQCGGWFWQVLPCVERCYKSMPVNGKLTGSTTSEVPVGKSVGKFVGP